VDGTWGREVGDSDEAEWAQGEPWVIDGEPQALRGLARLTSRSEEGGRVGELLPRRQSPIGPRKAGQEVVPKVKLVGVTLRGTQGEGQVSEEPGLVLFFFFFLFSCISFLGPCSCSPNL
jgi:hypothetical protein